MHPYIEDKKPMSAAAFDDRIHRWVDLLHDARSAEASVSKIKARALIARETGVPAGTLENISRERTKGVRGWVAERIRLAVVRQLERELMRVTHELEIARQCGCDPRDRDIQEIAAGISNLRRALEGLK